MKQVVIENPIINSPFDEPTRHFRFSNEGITNEIDNGRRPSSYFVPIAKPSGPANPRQLSQLRIELVWDLSGEARREPAGKVTTR